MIPVQLLLVDHLGLVVHVFELEPFLMSLEMYLNPFHPFDEIRMFGLLIFSERGEVQFVVVSVGLHSLGDQLFGFFDGAVDAVRSLSAAGAAVILDVCFIVHWIGLACLLFGIKKGKGCGYFVDSKT